MSLKNRQLIILTPLDGSPATKKGLKPFDQIVKIDGKITTGLSLKQAGKLIRGPKNTTVTLSILRGAETVPRQFTLKRGRFNVPSAQSRMLAPGLGYLRITQFQSNTYEEFLKALKSLHKSDKKLALKGLVLDLRNNRGGFVGPAFSVADAFINSGIIYGNSSPRVTVFHPASSDSIEPLIPMVVLVNRGTASAAELVASALKENRRALVMGERTFGKTLKQITINIEQEYSLTLSIQSVLSPSGEKHSEGMEPNISVTFSDEANAQGDPLLDLAIDWLKTKQYLSSPVPVLLAPHQTGD